MNPRFYRIAFGGQTKRVPADRIENVISFRPPFSQDNINGGIASDMPDMKPFTRWIWKLYQPIELLSLFKIFCSIWPLLLPNLLPLLFYFRMVIQQRALLPFICNLFRCFYWEGTYLRFESPGGPLKSRRKARKQASGPAIGATRAQSKSRSRI